MTTTEILNIKDEDFPVLVFANQDANLVSFLIDWKTKSSYNHVMWMHKRGKLASQGGFYKEILLVDCLKKGRRLKFFRFKNILKSYKTVLLYKIQKELEMPWYDRMYDFLGIFGQAIGLKFINSPFRNYCSERVGNDLRVILKDVPVFPTPHDINEFCISRPEDFELLGIWEEEL